MKRGRRRIEETPEANGSAELGGGGAALVPFKTIVNVGARELTIGGAGGEATIQAYEVPALERALELFKGACGAGERVIKRRRRRGAGIARGVGKAARRSKGNDVDAEEITPRRRRAPADTE